MLIGFVICCAGWLVLLVYTVSHRLALAAADRRKLAKLNGAMLLAGVLAAFTACATPVFPLIRAFEEVAQLPPGEKSPRLEQRINENRMLMPISLLTLPILIATPLVFFSNRRRFRSRAERLSASAS